MTHSQLVTAGCIPDCDEPFEPPPLFKPAGDTRKCRDAFDDLVRNMDRCGVPPDVGCNCDDEAYHPPGGWNECGDVCPPTIVSTEANDNLKFSVDDPYSGVDVESTLWWLLAFTAVTSAGGSFRTSGPLGPNPAPDVDIDTDEVDVPTILDRSQELLINAAWNVLVENIDIALWLACLVGGPDASRCIDGRITGKQEVVFDYSVGSVHEDSTMWMEISPNPSTPIHVNMYRFARLADRFEHATTTSDWTDQACVVVEVASLVLHELFHTCIPRSKVEPGDDRGECNRTYMLQASFQWAMAQRIPCITAGDGCGSFGGDENWMCDNPTNC